MNTQYRRKLSFVGLFIILLIGGHFLWRSAEDLPTSIVFPPVHKIPVPNAYDYYLLADKHVTSLAMLPKDARGVADLPWDTPNPEKFTQALKEQVLAESRPALSTLHEGFSYVYQAPSSGPSWFDDPSSEAIWHADGQLSDLARFLRFAAETKAARGDWDGALSSDFDAMRLRNDIQQQATLMSLFPGLAALRNGRTQAWKSLDHLNAAHARAATVRMQEIISRQCSLTTILLGEKCATQATLLQIFNRPNWRMTLALMIAIDYESPRWVACHFITKRQVLTEVSNYFDRLIDESYKPYQDRMPVPDLHIPFCQLCDASPKTGNPVAVNETENALLLTAFALQVYKAEHGVYPVTLHTLIPQYLTNIPVDPFAHANTLRYRVQGEKYLLYSVGPDGRDDGGRPIENPTEKDARRYTIFLPFSNTISDGDIVAGLNVN